MSEFDTGSIFQRGHDAVADKLPGLAAPGRVWVVGAGGGIGSALCDALAELNPAARLLRLSRRPYELPPTPLEHMDLALDYEQPESIVAALESLPDEWFPDWLLIATGWLHDDETWPEKSLRELDADHLARAYRINAIGPAMLIKALDAKLPRKHALRIGVLSARVGSISDNRLGG
ncbi:MAG: hypothetical protein ACPG4N_03825, partial [Gammaproteobacteria bacterium]